MFKALALTTLTLASASALSTPMQVDGNLADWGVSVQDSRNAHPASVFTTVNVGAGNKLFSYSIEDTNDLAGHGFYLGPQYGGQDYDVEFMAAALSAGRVFLAIATGQRPDNGFSYYSPGDIRIVADTGAVYGIEVGGGKGDSSKSQGAIQAGAAGTTYLLDGSGNTVNVKTAAASQVAGSVWSNVSWIKSPVDHRTDVQFEVNSQSTRLGVADFVYTRDSHHPACGDRAVARPDLVHRRPHARFLLGAVLCQRPADSQRRSRRQGPRTRSPGPARHWPAGRGDGPSAAATVIHNNNGARCAWAIHGHRGGRFYLPIWLAPPDW